MEIRKGIGVSPGIVISTAVVLDAEDLLIPRRTIPAAEVSSETRRLQKAISASVADLATLRDSITTKHGKQIGGIFDFHLSLLKDRALLKALSHQISETCVTAEYAVSTVMRRYAANFHQMSDRYFSERVKDIHDIERRVLRALIGRKIEDLLHLDRDVVIIARDLLPSQTASLDRTHVKGFAPMSVGAPVIPPFSPARWGFQRWWGWEIWRRKFPAVTRSSSTAIAAW